MSCRHEVLRRVLRVKRSGLRQMMELLPAWRRVVELRGCALCRRCFEDVRESYTGYADALVDYQRVARCARRALAQLDRADKQVGLFEEYPYPESCDGWSEQEWGWFQATLNALAALGGVASVYALRRRLEAERVIRFEEGDAYEAFLQGLDGVSGLCVREGKVWRVRLDAEASGRDA